MRLRRALVLAIIACATSAYAQRREGPCAADVQKFCSGVSAGGGRIKACLHEHESALTAGCQAVLANKTPGAGRQMSGAWPQSCQSDVDTLCKGVPVGKGQVTECLRSHSDQLSAACKTALAQRAEQRAAAVATRGAATPVAAATPAATAKKK